MEWQSTPVKNEIKIALAHFEKFLLEVSVLHQSHKHPSPFCVAS
jgi:hypothetical protein